jgi:hypothetical protein
VGLLAASYLGPRYIEWDNSTSVQGSNCPCAETARQGATRLVYYQLNGGGIGAGVGAAAGILFLWIRRKKAQGAASTPAAPPAPKV